MGNAGGKTPVDRRSNFTAQEEMQFSLARAIMLRDTGRVAQLLSLPMLDVNAALDYGAEAPGSSPKHDNLDLLEDGRQDGPKGKDGRPTCSTEFPGGSFLMLAAAAGDAKTAAALLAKGANVNAASSFDRVTALMVASRRGDAAIVALLLAHGNTTTAASTAVATAAATAGEHGEPLQPAAATAAAAAAAVDVNWSTRRGGDTALMLAAAACFDPREAVPLWQRMGQASGGQAPPEFSSTHPNPGTRIQNLQALMPKALEYRQKFCERAK